MNVRKPTPRALAATLGALTLAGVVSASAVHPRGTTTAESMPDGVAAAAGGRAGARDPEFRNVAYDGRFTFARIRFTPQGAWGWYEGGPDVKWHHDFPRAERNFTRILRELTTLRPYEGGGNVLTLDDPALMQYPLAYLCEPGYWAPTETEARALRTYLAKGGFIIFDDFFGGRAWQNFETQIRRVLPEGRLVRLDASHPIFDSFYRIEQVAPDRGFRRGLPEFWGVFEDDDPTKRLLLVANYNSDLGEGWEWSDEPGAMPVDLTSTDFKLGVNYLVYGMTR